MKTFIKQLFCRHSLKKIGQSLLKIKIEDDGWPTFNQLKCQYHSKKFECTKCGKIKL